MLTHTELVYKLDQFAHSELQELDKISKFPLIIPLAQNKFKIKIKQVKPVLHYVMTDAGTVDIFEYSAEGTKLIDSTDNVEQYIRDQVDTNAFYETENKIIIDDVVGDKFTKEGQKRFKPLFAPAKKIAKKLSARLSF